MGTIADVDDLINKLLGGNNGFPEMTVVRTVISNNLLTVGTLAGGGFMSAWVLDGDPASSLPTTVVAPDKTTAGAIPFTAATGGRAKMVVGMTSLSPTTSLFVATGFEGVMLYDRLLHIGGIDATVITPQTVGGTLTRNTGGEGNRIYWECHTTLGTAADRTLTASYTNQAGTAGRTTRLARTGSNSGYSSTFGGVLELPLQGGDSGVRSVESVTFAASAAGGTGGIFIGRPLLFSPTHLGTRTPSTPDSMLGMNGIAPIHADACLSLIGHRQSTVISTALTFLQFMEA